MALDVFDCHRGIIHQDPDGQRQTPSVYDVDRLTKQAQDCQETTTRKRNKIPQMISVLRHEPRKSKNHERGQSSCNHTFLTTPLDRRPSRKRIDRRIASPGYRSSRFLRMLAMAAFTPAATESVDALPFLKLLSRVLRRYPATMFSCGK